jgi:hypothetical protein
LQIPYPTASFQVYLPDTGLKLDGSPLQAAGPAQLGGQSYALYSASNLPKSTMVGGQVSGLGSNGAIGPNQLALISLGVVLFVIGGGVLVFGSRVRRGAAPRDRSSGDPEQERLELVIRMASLDERFTAGKIGRTEYDAERARGKKRLRELTLARKQATPIGV